MATATERTKRPRASIVKRLSGSEARTVEVKVTASEAREGFSAWISTVIYGHKWVVLLRHGKPAAAMVSLEDLNILRQLEDRIDLEAARKALKEPGEVPWEEVKAKLAL